MASKGKKLNAAAVAVMYIGVIMGAGFASGRESWQFFGIYGSKGYFGALIAGVGFAVLAFMIAYISIRKQTQDVGRIISPIENKTFMDVFGYVLACFMYTTIISMSAAGGSFLNQQFGIPNYVGGGIITVLVAVTVVGDFKRIADVMRKVVPVIFVIVIACAIAVIIMEPTVNGKLKQNQVNTGLAGNWLTAAFIFVSYNMIGAIAIGSASSINAKSRIHALTGSAIGGMMLGVMTMIMIIALNKDPSYSNRLDLPMLGYSSRISLTVGIAFGVALYFSIYSAATTVFYGFTEKIKPGPNRDKKIIMSLIIGFLIGLSGFKNIVAYLYPVEGYVGFICMVLIVWNFIKLLLWRDRFDYPHRLTRVTAGAGGECILIFGDKKTAVYDCGMAYCNKKTILNIEKKLAKYGFAEPDYILLSHSHYDHIGALPYMIKRWNNVEIVASAKTKDVFERAGAKETMKRLGEIARDLYAAKDRKSDMVEVDPLRVDITAGDGFILDLGGCRVRAIETRGHTDCSISYFIEPDSILLLSESTGVFEPPDKPITSILKGYDESIESTYKCMDLNAKHLIMPHYGLLPESVAMSYFEKYIEAAKFERELIVERVKEGRADDEILAELEDIYWTNGRNHHQPKSAFIENAKWTVRSYRKDVERMEKQS